MHTDQTISKFYADVKGLGLKFPVAAISKATGYTKGQVSKYLQRKDEPSQNFLEAFYSEFAESLKKVSHGTHKEAYTGHQTSPGFVPAEELISVLKQQNEFLRRNFETSLASIVEGQQQTGVQLKAISWFQALAAAGGDEKKALESIAAINNKIAFYEGIDGEGDNQKKGDRMHTGGSRQQK